MTGVGKVAVQYEGKNIIVFIKTLNSKQLDMSSRLPLCYREREIEVRNLVAERLFRGKIELSITVDDVSSSLAGVQRVNEAALQYYIKELDRINPTLFADQVRIHETLLRLPGVLVSNELAIAEVSEEEWSVVRDAIVGALDAVQAFRRQEGVMLEEVVARRITNIGELLLAVEQPEGERIEAIRTRLAEALEKISPDGIDRGRLEQEMIFYIEKLDINEEKDRLRHHLAYFMEVMGQSDGQQGKTLGFIAQEIGREINTLGSKSNNAQMQQIVVRMKDELEQIKEQSLNIL